VLSGYVWLLTDTHGEVTLQRRRHAELQADQHEKMRLLNHVVDPVARQHAVCVAEEEFAVEERRIQADNDRTRADFYRNLQDTVGRMTFVVTEMAKGWSWSTEHDLAESYSVKPSRLREIALELADASHAIERTVAIGRPATLPAPQEGALPELFQQFVTMAGSYLSRAVEGLSAVGRGLARAADLYQEGDESARQQAEHALLEAVQVPDGVGADSALGQPGR
jgi:hypothetical protein